ncbi:hypothetical protein [Enterobacter sp. CP102]|nr:hypothetical protein [Enterobacter sp. CP102]UWM66230.1 hypothetical protein N1249_10565 [Enterobacter sp. CP102]
MRDLVPLSWRKNGMWPPERPAGSSILLSPQDELTNAARDIIFSY